MSFDYSVNAISTVGLRGIRFRSQLEAQWAEMFECLKWAWEYEPFPLGGYIPDFIVTPFGASNKILVEVKPEIEFLNLAKYTDRIRQAGWKETIMVVGAKLFTSSEIPKEIQLGNLDNSGLIVLGLGNFPGSCFKCRNESILSDYQKYLEELKKENTKEIAGLGCVTYNAGIYPNCVPNITDSSSASVVVAKECEQGRYRPFCLGSNYLGYFDEVKQLVHSIDGNSDRPQVYRKWGNDKDFYEQKWVEFKNKYSWKPKVKVTPRAPRQKTHRYGNCNDYGNRRGFKQWHSRKYQRKASNPLAELSTAVKFITGAVRGGWRSLFS